MKKRFFIKFLLATASAPLLFLNSCGDKQANQVWKSTEPFESGGKLRIAATTTMVQDLVRVIAGDDAEVYGLMGEGIDPHSYKERPSDMVALKSADVIFYSGLHLEEKLQEKLENLPQAHAVTAKIEKSLLIIPEEKYDAFKSHIITALRHIIFWSLPAIALIVVVRAQLVRVVLGTGASWINK